MGSPLTIQDVTYFAANLEFQTQTLLTGAPGGFVTPSEEPGVHKPVNRSPSSICRFTFPLLQEYFQW